MCSRNMQSTARDRTTERPSDRFSQPNSKLIRIGFCANIVWFSGVVWLLPVEIACARIYLHSILCASSIMSWIFCKGDQKKKKSVLRNSIRDFTSLPSRMQPIWGRGGEDERMNDDDDNDNEKDTL